VHDERHPNPHDAFFKQFLPKPEIAADFLTQPLPGEVLGRLDLATLEEQKESFIDEELRRHFSDILCRVASIQLPGNLTGTFRGAVHLQTISEPSKYNKCRSSLMQSESLRQVKTKQGKPLYIYQLFEHKSEPDRGVAFQLLRYKVRIWEKEWAKTHRLSPIMALVVYHGVAQWMIPQHFTAFFQWAEDEPGRATLLRVYLPEFSYHLVDLSALSDEESQGGVWLRVFELLLKHIFD
jgi:predicted transposase YdaD